MTTSSDLQRIHVVRSGDAHPSVMLGWVMIVVIVAGGFSALAYAIGKFQGMGVCK